jgi:hypothetical protein
MPERLFSEYAESGEIAKINLGGTKPGNKVPKIADVNQAAKTLSRQIDRAKFKTIGSATRLGSALTKPKIENAVGGDVPPDTGFFLTDTEYMFLVWYDGNKYWYERLTEAV